MLPEHLPSAYLIAEAQTVDNTAPGASTHSFPYLKMNDRAYIFSRGNTTRQIEALCWYSVAGEGTAQHWSRALHSISLPSPRSRDPYVKREHWLFLCLNRQFPGNSSPAETPPGCPASMNVPLVTEHGKGSQTMFTSVCLHQQIHLAR